jgi:hypothetical protein
MIRRAGLSSAAVVLAVASVARADPAPLGRSLQGQAADDYRAGRTLYDDGDYAGAELEFQSALARSGDARLYWNLAVCAKGRRHYAAALALLDRFRADTSGVVSAADRRDADEFASAMAPFVVDVTFDVSEPGAEVFVDDVSVGTSPVAARKVDVGARRFRVAKAGFRPVETVARVGVTPTWSLHAKLEARAATLRVRAAAGARVVIDGAPRGTGAADVGLAPGVHALRVEADGMRPFEAQVPLDDGESRELDVTLDPLDSARERPRIDVAIGCGDLHPLGAEDGLRLYVDGAVEKPIAEERRDGAVVSVAYPIDRGRHAVRAYVPDCSSLEAAADVTSPKVRLDGALPSSEPFYLRGPAGRPDGLRVGASFLSAAVTIDNAAGVFDGVAANLALVRRYWVLAADVGAMAGTAAHPSSEGPRSHGAEYFAIGRFGARVPLNFAALSAGVGLDLEIIHWPDTDEPTGGANAWVALDLSPFCDWLLPASALIDSGALGSVLEVGLAYQPSARCHAERETVFGVRAQ